MEFCENADASEHLMSLESACLFSWPLLQESSVSVSAACWWEEALRATKWVRPCTELRPKQILCTAIC